MEISRNVSKWGNSAGVLLPKEWLGKEVNIILIDRTSEIKKEGFDILDSYLEDIIGIYLIGSYARKEIALAVGKKVFLDLTVQTDPHWQKTYY